MHIIPHVTLPKIHSEVPKGYNLQITMIALLVIPIAPASKSRASEWIS
jgi:hypothetical protein